MRPVAAPRTPYGQRVLHLFRVRAPSIAAFLVIVLLFDMMRTWSLALDADTVWRTVPLWLLAGVAVLVPLLVEATGLRGLRLVLCMVPATIVAVGLLAVLLGVLHPTPLGDGVRQGAILSNESFLFRGWWLYSVGGLLFAAYCQMREREQSVLRAARDAELVRADAQREIVASRLKVLQARVEPELLFDALADVRAAYLRDPAVADALLDDLVAYLRAALPQMRGGASTLAREAMLAEAYLRVLPAGREGRLAVTLELPAALGGEDFPPLVLLPLVHAAVDAMVTEVRIVAAAPGTASPSRSLAVIIPGGLVPPGWSDDALHVVRATLLDYLGAGTTLRVTRDEGSLRATVAWMATRPRAPVPAAAVSSADSPDSSRAS